MVVTIKILRQKLHAIYGVQYCFSPHYIDLNRIVLSQRRLHFGSKEESEREEPATWNGGLWIGSNDFENGFAVFKTQILEDGT